MGPTFFLLLASTAATTTITTAATVTAATTTTLPSTRTLTIHVDGLAKPVKALELACADDLLDDEAAIADDECDVYGACLWPSSYVLARALLREPATTLKHVVELGCGAAALPSLSALAAGASSVVATDWAPLARELASASAYQFQPKAAERLQTTHFDVRDALRDDFVLPWSPCTHLVCADMLYDARAARAVGACVAHAVLQGATALVADPGRLDGQGREHFCRGVQSVAGGDATWAQREHLVFDEEAIAHADLQSFGASLSWCGQQETAVGVLRLSAHDGVL